MKIDLNSLKGRRVLVVGDLMLDTYHVGVVKRISPEAPVPVVRVNRSYSVLGGAANVARNLLGLGAVPSVVGVVGDDESGRMLSAMFEDLSIDVCLELSPNPTITKTRVVGNDQQVVRIDFERDNAELPLDVESRIIESVGVMMRGVDIVVISDYGKGMCSPQVCHAIIEMAISLEKKVVVDPKGTEWNKYRNATVVTPNIKELSDVSNVELPNEDNPIHLAAQTVVESFGLGSILVTRSEKGMSYISCCEQIDIPTEAREVFDVSGAGDTVVATLAAALAANISIQDSIYLANKAAGVVVAKMGTTPIQFDELLEEVHHSDTQSCILHSSELPELVKHLRTQGRRVVFTNGCFDILHRGHVSYLSRAKQLGDVLILGLNSDASVRRLKGESRPINDEFSRAMVMSALKSVDYVVVFEEDTPLNIIEVVRPDVLVKGGDYAIEDIVGREFAKQTTTISFVDGFSTSATLEKMNSK